MANSGAAQERSRRVFTNEDIARPATPPPAAVEPASQPATDAASEPAETTSVAESEPEEPPEPKPELQRALELQQMLRQSLDDFQSKIATETDSARRSRLTRMSACINALLEDNEQIINELSQQNAQPSSSPRES
jgi:hypothetical protein